ncbi:MAG: hypothetical protein AB8B87_09115 [Granulosicoccus sp.]
MSLVVQKRHQRAAAARVLLALHAKGNLENPSMWSWEAVDRLPAWCLASADERVHLQLTCGTLYLSPDIRFWISKSALIAVQSLIGEMLFERIMTKADTMQLPRESVSAIVTDFGVDPANAEAGAVKELLMAAGSKVLCATVHPDLPREMLTASLGPSIGDITEESAEVLLNAAQALVQESVASVSAAQ